MTSAERYRADPHFVEQVDRLAAQGATNAATDQ